MGCDLQRRADQSYSAKHSGGVEVRNRRSSLTHIALVMVSTPKSVTILSLKSFIQYILTILRTYSATKEGARRCYPVTEMQTYPRYALRGRTQIRHSLSEPDIYVADWYTATPVKSSMSPPVIYLPRGPVRRGQGQTSTGLLVTRLPAYLYRRDLGVASLVRVC